MTDLRNSNSKNPTLREVNDTVVALSKKVDVMHETMNERFLISDKRFIALNNRIDGIDARLGTIERGMGKMQGTILDIQDDLTASLAAIDRDSLTLFDHEHRLVKLEAA